MLMLVLLTVLSQLLTKVEHHTLKADLNVTIASDANPAQAMTYAGDLWMVGNKFLVNMFGVEVSYDGKTLYSYNEDADEVTLTTPTEQELLQTNPFLFAKALMGACTLQETALKDGRETIITLTPKQDGTGIRKLSLRVETTTLLPLLMEVSEQDGKQLSLRLNQVAWTDSVPAFVLNKQGAYINDLR